MTGGERRRPYWRGLFDAYRLRKKGGTRIFKQFRAQAAQQERPKPQNAAWQRSGLQPHECSALRHARILFLLPSASPGGGTKVVLAEARCLRALGIDVWIANHQRNRPGFAPLLGPDDPPTFYLNEFTDVVMIAREFDVVIATAWWTTEGLRALAKLSRRPTLAYYVQDYEPYFYADNAGERQRARDSYHLPSECILFTKTAWTQQEVLRHENVRCVPIGPSYDAVEFSADNRVARDTAIRVCAMVRPDTPRRGPHATMSVLRRLKQRYGARLHVATFGCSREALETTSLDTAFEFEHVGILIGDAVADLLRRNDIFLDLSTFQAMGLTAMEAMACEVAVIGPARGGLCEIIEHGISGLLVDTLDEEACVAAAAMLIEDTALLDQLARRGRRTVARFESQAAATRLARLLLLDKKAG